MSVWGREVCFYVVHQVMIKWRYMHILLTRPPSLLYLSSLIIQAFILFGEPGDLKMFNESYETIKFYLRKGYVLSPFVWVCFFFHLQIFFICIVIAMSYYTRWSYSTAWFMIYVIYLLKLEFSPLVFLGIFYIFLSYRNIYIYIYRVIQ